MSPIGTCGIYLHITKPFKCDNILKFYLRYGPPTQNKKVLLHSTKSLKRNTVHNLCIYW